MRILLPTYWTDDFTTDAEFAVWNAEPVIVGLLLAISAEVKQLKKRYQNVEHISLKNLQIDLTFLDRERNEDSPMYAWQDNASEYGLVEIPEDLDFEETDHRTEYLEAIVSDEWVYFRACDHGTNNVVETEMIQLALLV
jgi:hypothetical protein